MGLLSRERRVSAQIPASPRLSKRDPTDPSGRNKAIGNAPAQVSDAVKKIGHFPSARLVPST